LLFSSILPISENKMVSGHFSLCRFVFYLSIGVQYFVKLGAKIQIIFHIKRIWGESIYIFKK